METVVLVVHLLLALGLIGVVLLQRSEGGGLGMGAGGVMTGRGQATALGRVTWGFAGAFIATSIALTVIAAQNAGGASVVDQLRASPGAAESGEESALPDLGGGSLLPPDAGDAPLVPLDEAPLAPAADAPAETAPVDAAPADAAPTDAEPSEAIPAPVDGSEAPAAADEGTPIGGAREAADAPTVPAGE